MAREWGGVKELGLGCWWLAVGVAGWRILAVEKRCRPVWACGCGVRGTFPGLAPPGYRLSPLLGLRQAGGGFPVLAPLGCRVSPLLGLRRMGRQVCGWVA